MGTPLRVLIVEDSEEDTLLIVRELKRGGFDPIHERIETAESMKTALSTKTWDLILADYSMPHFSGLEALKLSKESGLDLPFIIVSGSIGEDVAVEAMKSGAHDYLMKNNLARLVPSIQQELREAEVRRKLKEYQNALQESEKRYRQLVESATEIIYTVDEKGNFTYGNPAGLKVTGYSLQELRGLNYTDLVLPEHRERVMEIYINQFRQRIPTTHVEFPFLSKTGKIIWFGQNTSLVIEDGKVVGFHIIARDITERKQAEERLQERERYFRTMMYTLREDIVVIDCDYRITDVNNTFLITTGSSREQVIGKHCYEISHGYAEPCDRHGEQCLLGEVFETGQSRNCKHVHMPGDGSKVHVDILLSPLKDDSGSVTHVVEAVRNVTDLMQAYEALRSNEEKYRAILENIEEGYYEVDIAGNFSFLNDSMCRIYGYPKEELMGMNDRQYTDEENTKRLFQAFNKVYRTGEPHIGYDYEIIRKDGAKRYVEASILLQKDSSGKPLGFRGIIRDITERKRAEQALFDSEQRYRNLVENAPDVIFTLAPDGTITSLNPAFETITGWSRSEWLGKAFTAILRPDDLSQGLEFFQSVFKGEKTAPFELGVLKESGDYLTAEFTVTPQTHDGSVIGVLGIARDITDRKRAEEALKKSEERLRLAAESSSDLIYEWDTKERVDWFGKIDELLGYAPNEFPRTFEAWTNSVHPDDRDRVMTAVENHLEKDEPYDIEYRVRRKDSTYNYWWVRGTAVRDEKGNPYRWVGAVTDVTERKQAEERLHLQSAALEAAANAIIITDHEGMIEWANPAFTVLTGYSHIEVVGRSPRELVRSGKQDQAFYKDLWDTILAGKVWRGQIINGRKDGSLYTEEMTITPLHNERGEISRFIAIKQDITERKQAEESLKESEENARQFAQENTIMAEIGRIISSTLDIDGVYEGFSAEVKKIIPFDRIVINIIDEEKGTVKNVYMAGKGLQDRNVKDIYPLEGSGNAEMLRTKSTLLIQTEDFSEFKDRFPMLWSTFQAGFRSIMNVPLFSKGKVIGGLLLRSHKPYVYTDKDVRLAERIASQIAGAVANAQLYAEGIHAEEALRRSEEEARRLAQENAIMAEVGRIISSTFNVEEVYERFAEEARKLIPFDRIMINLIDLKNNTSITAYIAGIDVPGRRTGDVTPLASTVTEEVIRTRSSLLIQEDNVDEVASRFPALLPTFRAGLRSAIFVPLISEDQVIGVLSLRSLVTKAYTDQDVRLTESIANQIAGAIANAQLYAERIQAEKEKAVLEDQLRQSQKMEAIGRLAGGIAHDFNNLLTVITGYSQLSLTEMKKEDPLRGNIEEIKKSGDRAADLTRQLLAFSRRQVMEMRVLDLNELLTNLDKMLRRVIGEDIDLVTLLEKNLGRVKTDPGQIEQVIMNLAVNARDAMSKGGKLTIETANVDLDQAYARAHVAVKPGPYVMISASDTGVGMPPEIRDRIFEPFFTTKEKGKGTGLGLSTVYGIVKQSGGNIWVYSEPEKGTTFKIYLPRVDEPFEELKEKLVKEELPRGNETILIVEDEENVLRLAGRILRRQGYTVLEASQGEKALLLCEEHKGALHLILTDVVMPEMSGRQLVDRCWQVRQDFKTLYMSGYTDNAITHHGVLEKGTNYIQKPFTVDGLARKVRGVLDKL